MRVPCQVALLLTLSLALFAQSSPDRLAQLKAKAAAANPSEQEKLFLEIARAEFGEAKNAYAAGNAQQAQLALSDLESYARRASQLALEHRKRIKNTEIELRKISDRLKNLKPTLNVEDRAPVQQAIDTIEKLRTDLMSKMFSKTK
jgi:flagellin-specific chaperone FliS